MPIVPTILAAAPPAALASGDGVPWVKLVVFAIFGLIWLISAAAKALTSKKPTPPQTPWVPTPPTNLPQGYAPVAPPPAQWSAAPQPAPKQQQQRKSKKQKQKQLVAELTAADLVPETAPLLRQTPPAVPRSTGQGVQAAAVRRLLTPAALRRQYVVSELFDPPPSTRG
ncbi:MAG TPA: hypothetical protein VF796_26210 [Humisphaera sp.]